MSEGAAPAERSATLAIVVVNYGSTTLLEANLAPLSRVRPKALVVVVDNFSGAAERRDLVALAAREGWATVLPGDNGGFGTGVNLGVAEATALGASAVVLVNPDAQIDGEALDELGRLVDARPDVMVAPRILRPDGSVWFEGADLYTADGRVRSRRRRPESAREGVDVEPWLSGACLALSVDLFERAGGFDPAYFLYWEDIDFSRRVVDAGGSLEIARDVSVVHAEGGTQTAGGHASSGEAKSSTYYYYNIRNRLLFAARHLDTASLERWLAVARPIAWEVLLQGGRRQFVRSPGTLLVGVRALRDARRVARDELSRRAGESRPQG